MKIYKIVWFWRTSLPSTNVVLLVTAYTVKTTNIPKNQFEIEKKGSRIVIDKAIDCLHYLR